MKKILGFLVCCFMSFSSYAVSLADVQQGPTAVANACQNAAPANSPAFCSTFVTAARCHCSDGGLPPSACKQMPMSKIYQMMLDSTAPDHTMEEACSRQSYVSTQECIDDWNCYRLGGSFSGGACSGTGSACPPS